MGLWDYGTMGLSEKHHGLWDCSKRTVGLAAGRLLLMLDIGGPEAHVHRPHEGLHEDCRLEGCRRSDGGDL
jgi:hypothetical protein